MPESKGRAKPKSRTNRKPVDVAAPPQVNAPWFVPVMVGLMVFGVLWVTVFYVTSGDWPVPGIGYWNLVVGLGAIMAGFMMSTRWR